VSHRLKRPIAGSDRSRPEAPIYPDGANGGEPINHAVPDETARVQAFVPLLEASCASRKPRAIDRTPRPMSS
jgi:hypothetical protein